MIYSPQTRITNITGIIDILPISPKSERYLCLAGLYNKCCHQAYPSNRHAISVSTSTSFPIFWYHKWRKPSSKSPCYITHRTKTHLVPGLKDRQSPSSVSKESTMKKRTMVIHSTPPHILPAHSRMNETTGHSKGREE